MTLTAVDRKWHQIDPQVPDLQGEIAVEPVKVGVVRKWRGKE